MNPTLDFSFHLQAIFYHTFIHFLHNYFHVFFTARHQPPIFGILNTCLALAIEATIAYLTPCTQLIVSLPNSMTFNYVNNRGDMGQPCLSPESLLQQHAVIFSNTNITILASYIIYVFVHTVAFYCALNHMLSPYCQTKRHKYIILPYLYHLNQLL